MKLLFASVFMLAISHFSIGQSLVGSWQLIEEKTCFQSNMKESDTELELKDGMGAYRNSVARLIVFGKKEPVKKESFRKEKRRVVIRINLITE